MTNAPNAPAENQDTKGTSKKQLLKKAYRRRYYLQNKDTFRRRSKEYYTRNIEKERQRQKDYYAKNVDMVRQRRKMSVRGRKTELHIVEPIHDEPDRLSIDSNIIDESGSVTKDSNIVNEIICRPFLNAFGFSYDEKMDTCTHKMCTHKGLTYCCECGEWGSYIDSLGGVH
jgi:hypothetical protein